MQTKPDILKTSGKFSSDTCISALMGCYIYSVEGMKAQKHI